MGRQQGIGCCSKLFFGDDKVTVKDRRHCHDTSTYQHGCWRTIQARKPKLECYPGRSHRVKHRVDKQKSIVDWYLWQNNQVRDDAKVSKDRRIRDREP